MPFDESSNHAVVLKQFRREIERQPLIVVVERSFINPYLGQYKPSTAL